MTLYVVLQETEPGAYRWVGKAEGGDGDAAVRTLELPSPGVYRPIPESNFKPVVAEPEIRVKVKGIEEGAVKREIERLKPDSEREFANLASDTGPMPEGTGPLPGSD